MQRKIMWTALALSTSLLTSIAAPKNFGVLSIDRSAKDGHLRLTCELPQSDVPATVEINEVTQFTVIDLGASRGRFSGVATKAEYTDNDGANTAYHLQNEGLPYFYDFSLVTAEATGQSTLTLVFGARTLACQTAN